MQKAEVLFRKSKIEFLGIETGLQNEKLVHNINTMPNA